MAWQVYTPEGFLKAQSATLSSAFVDNDGYLTANSGAKVPTQAAVKAALTLLLTAASNVWSGNNSYTGTGNFTSGSLLLPTGTPSILDDWMYWDSTKKQPTIGDGVRARVISSQGWVPYQYSPGVNAGNVFTTTGFILAANGGSVMIPVFVPGHMILGSLSFMNVDATLVRTCGWDLYQQNQQTPVAGENTLTRVANSTANDSFTAIAAGLRTIVCADTYLSPGVYWIVIQNRHATNTYSPGFLAGGSLNSVGNPYCQTKTTSNPNGATLDFVAATWAGNSSVLGVRLNGKVFGQSTTYS